LKRSGHSLIDEPSRNWRNENTQSTCLIPASCRCLSWLILRPLKLKRHFRAKYHLTFNRLHGVISQQIGIFITTDVRTGNPTTSVRIANVLAETRFPHKSKERCRYANLLGLFRFLVYCSQWITSWYLHSFLKTLRVVQRLASRCATASLAMIRDVGNVSWQNIGSVEFRLCCPWNYIIFIIWSDLPDTWVVRSTINLVYGSCKMTTNFIYLYQRHDVSSSLKFCFLHGCLITVHHS
jgi:hypothetical protein